MSKRLDAASRLILAPALTIYQAFATAGAMEAWLPPSGMIGRMLAFEFREGGGYPMRLTHGEPQGAVGKTSDDADEIEVRFAKLVPRQQIEQVAMFDCDDPAFAGEMRITWIVEPVRDATRVTVRCEDVPAGIGPEDHQAGLNSTLVNLATFAETQARGAQHGPPAIG